MALLWKMIGMVSVAMLEALVFCLDMLEFLVAPSNVIAGGGILAGETLCLFFTNARLVVSSAADET